MATATQASAKARAIKKDDNLDGIQRDGGGLPDDVDVRRGWSDGTDGIEVD